jgi:hypothetical protein
MERSPPWEHPPSSHKQISQKKRVLSNQTNMSKKQVLFRRYKPLKTLETNYRHSTRHLKPDIAMKEGEKQEMKTGQQEHAQAKMIEKVKKKVWGSEEREMVDYLSPGAPLKHGLRP